MSITRIETQQLRSMENNDGLVVQGCGGDLQEWADGINDMLTEADILKTAVGLKIVKPLKTKT